MHRQAEEFQRHRDELTRIREETLAQRQGIVERHNREREDLRRLQEELEQKAAHLRAQEQAFEEELRTRRQAVEEELQRLREDTEAEVRRWRGDGGQNLSELHDQIEKEILARYRTRTEELDRFQLSLARRRFSFGNVNRPSIRNSAATSLAPRPWPNAKPPSPRGKKTSPQHAKSWVSSATRSTSNTAPAKPITAAATPNSPTERQR